MYIYIYIYPHIYMYMCVCVSQQQTFDKRQNSKTVSIKISNETRMYSLTVIIQCCLRGSVKCLYV
jgi:hypothetical protein